MNLELEISKIRNIQEAKMTLPLQKGMYALVGENGCGKSTLMLIMSLLVKTSSAHMITSIDIQEDSTIVLKTDAGNDIWRYKNGKLTTGKYKTHKSFHKRSKTFGVKSHSTLVVSTHWPGFYEGSIFYGSRFYNFEAVDDFLQQDNCRDSLIEADIFVSEMLGYILHNNKAYYKNLFRIKNRATAEQNGLKGVPYFAEYNNQLVSQFKMSSGECLLLSLIDFISTLIIHGTHYKKFLLLIDEVELALHPGAIDRLISFLSKIIDDSDKRIVVYFSSHSAELIQKISPRNIYLIENDDGILTTVNPCYPNYAIRNLYIPNGFDFLLLVEDELAKVIVDNVIRENNLATSKLCCVLPAGGCTQMLKLHRDLVTYNTLGAGKRIISIYDGDAKKVISKKDDFKDLPKCFLPIPSVEKYLKSKLFDAPDKEFIKLIGDKYFNQRPLKDIILDYRNDPRTKVGSDNDGKNFYSVIISNLEKIGMSENDFIKFLASDIYSYEKPTQFVATLSTLLL